MQLFDPPFALGSLLDADVAGIAEQIRHDGAAVHRVRRQRSLDLDLYLTDEGPLLPKGADPGELKEDPRVEVANDDDVFPVQLFADDYVVVADSQDDDQVPPLSKGLDALQRGESMTGALRSA